MVVKEVVVM